MAELIATQKEINLLLGSRIIEDYPVLKHFIKNTPNLTKDKLYTLSQKEQLFFNDIYPKVRNEVINEWVVDKGSVDYVEENNVSCELCGHRPIKNICVIENAFTKKRLKVGTECVKYFGIGKDLDLNKLSKEVKRIRLLENLNSTFPGISSIIDNWWNLIDRQDMIIKYEIKKNYIKLGDKINELYNEYCDDKTNNANRINIINEIDLLLKDAIIEKENIEKYVNQTKDNLLAPKKIYFRDISAQYKNNAIKMVEEDGLIMSRTLWRINNLDFSNSLIESINSELNKINFNIENTAVLNGKIGYFIIYKNLKKFKLFCTYNDFCSNCYSIITGEDRGNKVDFDLLINISEIADEKSLERAVYAIFNMIKGSYFSVYYTDYDYNEIIVNNNNLYYKLDMKKFINSFKKEILIGSNEFGEKVLGWISENLSKAQAKSDVDYFIQNRKRS